jgi:hypothetical protein
VTKPSAWQWLNRNHRPSGKLDMVSRRFLQVFRELGVEIAQTPRLISEIRIAALNSWDLLLAENIAPVCRL